MFQASSQEEKEVILVGCTVEREAFVEGVVVAVENMTSGNNELKSMNLPLRIGC